MDFVVDYLKNHPTLVKEIATHFYKEWGYLHPELKMEKFESSVSGRLNIDKIPLALVAMESSKFVGTIGLTEFDMETRKDLSPWLAGLYVIEERRNESVGKLLINSLIEVSKRLGIQKLYLYTPSAKYYYTKLNWNVIRDEDYHGTKVTIMSKNL